VPLPEPKEGESEKAFLDRCMGDKVMVKEFEKPGQRLKVCEAQWKRGKAEAAVPANLVLRTEASDVAIQAAEDEEKKLRRFTMKAYTGGVMQLTGWAFPVVIDLVGLRVPRKSRPILKDHNSALIVGHSENVSKQNSTLAVSGVISGAGRVAQEVVDASENGFPWQASVGARVERVVFVPEGRKVKANGKEFIGPLYVVRKSTLGELSFVALGADEETSARVAASAAFEKTEILSMNFENWIKAQGFELADLSEEQTANLKAVFEKGESADASGQAGHVEDEGCLLYTSPSPRDRTRSRMPSSA